MDKNEKPLPRPPKTAFGRKRVGEEEGGQELLADRMAEAAAFGKLDEFLKHQIPDSEHARSLANMMMGMTGMIPQGTGTPPAGREGPAPDAVEDPAEHASPGVRAAVQAGDVQGLMELLRQEHLKRTGGKADAADEPPVPSAAPADELPAQEQAVLDGLIALAREHGVSPD